MSDVNLTIGDNSGTPPTGNVVLLYYAFNGAQQVGEYPSSHDFVRGGDITVSEALDGAGVINQPVFDSRIRTMGWAEIDGDLLDIPNGMIHELRARKFVNTASYYYMGSADLAGANALPENPIRIKIIDVITELVPNSENIKLLNVTMKYQKV